MLHSWSKAMDKTYYHFCTTNIRYAKQKESSGQDGIEYKLYYGNVHGSDAVQFDDRKYYDMTMRELKDMKWISWLDFVGNVFLGDKFAAGSA